MWVQLASYVLIGGLLIACQKHEAGAKKEGHTHDSPAAQQEPGDGPSHGDKDHAPQDAVRSEQGLYWASLVWSSDLKAGTLNNQASLSFWDESGDRIAGKLRSFRLYMPSMSHGSIRTGEMQMVQSPGEPSLWEVSHIFFSMGGGPGSWVVDIEAELAGQSDRVRVTIPHEVR